MISSFRCIAYCSWWLYCAKFSPTYGDAHSQQRVTAALRLPCCYAPAAAPVAAARCSFPLLRFVIVVLLLFPQYRVWQDVWGEDSGGIDVKGGATRRRLLRRAIARSVEGRGALRSGGLCRYGGGEVIERVGDGVGGWRMWMGTCRTAAHTSPLILGLLVQPTPTNKSYDNPTASQMYSGIAVRKYIGLAASHCSTCPPVRSSRVATHHSSPIRSPPGPPESPHALPYLMRIHKIASHPAPATRPRASAEIAIAGPAAPI
jgi:hypothetical protein